MAAPEAPAPTGAAPRAPAPRAGAGGSRLLGDTPEARARVRRLRLFDALVKGGITVGGLGIILAVLGIFVFVFAEAAPLLLPGKGGPLATPAGAVAAGSPGRALAVGEDEYRQSAWALSSTGRLRLLDLAGGRILSDAPLDGLGAASVLCGARALDDDVCAAGLSDGRALVAAVETEARYEDGKRVGQETRVAWQADLALREDGGAVECVAVELKDGRAWVAGASRGWLEVVARKPEGGRLRRYPAPAEAVRDLDPACIAIHQDAEAVIVGTRDGRLRRFEILEDALAPREDARVGAGPVTAVAYAFGSQTVLVGDASGAVSGWQGIRPADGGARVLARVREFAPAGAAVTAFAPSRRDKTFLVVDRAGGVRVDHATTERTVVPFEPGSGEPGPAAMAPKRDGAVVVGADGSLRRFAVEAPHPEVTLRGLFAPMLYEGYDGPEYVWQSTGGTDDFEPKFSLVPLVVGSLKGVLYALLFSLPLALLAAVYTSQFASPRLRGLIKPTVEVMAALPSVVIGFLAGLWLSPFVERNLVAVAGLAVLLPASLVAGVAAMRWLPGGLRRRLGEGGELVVLAPFLAAGLAGAFLAAPAVEDAFFGGDARAWMKEALGIVYDPRNAVVVGFALGFAVIPIIYTVAEDAMSNVPRSLRAASEALGASRWQTAWRLVLPASSPGIFAAVMLGFGRAIGETMIVVMATGNTPVLDFSPFNGMRTISACIAVEMPEAPVESSLYRVLFLAGALLFLFAFACNTAAEVVSVRLRSRYARW